MAAKLCELICFFRHAVLKVKFLSEFGVTQVSVAKTFGVSTLKFHVVVLYYGITDAFAAPRRGHSPAEVEDLLYTARKN